MVACSMKTQFYRCAWRTRRSGFNRTPDKRRSTHRIDGTVALIMALAMTPQVKPFDVEALIG